MTPAAPTLATAPTAAELLAAATCPVELARRITAVGRTCGTLPPDLAELRRTALRTARRAGWKVIPLAAAVVMSPARICQLTSSTFAPEATTTADPPNH